MYQNLWVIAEAVLSGNFIFKFYIKYKKGIKSIIKVSTQESRGKKSKVKQNKEIEGNSKRHKSTKQKTNNMKIDKDKNQFFKIIRKIKNPQID